jgi:glycosyltransferase involved in cell wall biosynthesis
VRDALERIFEGDRIVEFAHNMIEERKRFSWGTMCDEIEAVYRSLVE